MLAQALVNAKKRGVKVEVTLNGEFDLSQPDGLNAQAAEFLRAAGVETYLGVGPLLHAKTLVVDGKVLLLGSSNWSASAFSKNLEGNALIRSTEAAQAALGDFAAMKRRPVEPPSAGAIPIPEAFFGKGGALDSMTARGDTRGFDAYLLLLKWREEKGTDTFAVDKEKFARAVGLPGKKASRDNFEIRRILTKLEKLTGLLTTAWEEGKDPVITLARTAKVAVRMPAGYLDWGWNRRLSLGAKTFYLIGLKESRESAITPRWSEDQTTLAGRYGLRNEYFIRGLTELRRAGLVAVEYSPLTMNAGPRMPNTYTMRPLYDPAPMEARFETMERTHGAQAMTRGRDIAALVYEDWNAELVERLILAEKRHGRKKMDAALEIIRAKKGDNPKRSAGYLLGILEKQESGNPLEVK